MVGYRKKVDVPSFDHNRSQPKYFNNELSTAQSYFGLYLGIVKNTQDIQHMGRLQVFLPDDGGDEDNKDLWRTVSYCTPFGGSSPAMERFWERDTAEYDYTPTSYGFWAVPPDVGNKVLIMFINGDQSRGVWIGVMYDSFMNHNVPGLAADDSHNNPNDKVHKFQNVTEYNKFNDEITNPLLPAVRPYHKRQYERMSQTAQHEDPYRGWTTSSAQRETPSAVYGMSTPGPIDPLATNVGETFKRSGGHQFVMDDGDIAGNNRLIRLRARGGAQLLIHDTLGFVYICNKMGTAWVELDKNGNVEVYSNNSISLRANTDINMRADRDFNLDIGRDLNVYMPADYETNEEKGIQTDLQVGTGGDFDQATPNFRSSKVSGLKSDVPNGSIVLQVKEGQVHTTVETGSVFHTMGTGNYYHTLENGNYYRTIKSGIFNAITASDHYQEAGGRIQHHSLNDMILVSDNWLRTRGHVEVNHSSGGNMNVNVDANLFMSAGSDFHRTAGGMVTEDATTIYHNQGNAEEAFTFATTANVFPAIDAVLPALQEFEDMIKYDPAVGPTTVKVDRRMTRYPTMEPYGGLAGLPGEGSLYHIDETTAGAVGVVTGTPVEELKVMVDTFENILPTGKFSPKWVNPNNFGVEGFADIPEAVDGWVNPNKPAGQYVGTHYDAMGLPHYEQVAATAALPPATAELSGIGEELIKSFEEYRQHEWIDPNTGKTFIGHGHLVDPETTYEGNSSTKISEHADQITVRNTSDLQPFGKMKLGEASEWISWASKTSTKLLGCVRGLYGTIPQSHKKGVQWKMHGESYPDGITRQQANALFDNDIKKSVSSVRKNIKMPINQNQADALISLAQSLGPATFARSEVAKAINQKDFPKATTEFMRYNRAPTAINSFENGVLVKTMKTAVNPGLTKRRTLEAKLFCTPATPALRSTVNKSSGGYEAYMAKQRAAGPVSTLGGGISGLNKDGTKFRP